MARQHPPIDIDLPSGLTDHSILTIRTCRPNHATAVLERAHRWRHNVGWLPRAAIETNIAKGWFWEAYLDGQECGHVMISGGERTPCCLRHNCIDEELWSQGLGKTLTAIYLAYARLTSPHAYARVRTRADLARQTAINLRLGFHVHDADPPRKTTRHRVVTWHRPTRHGNARSCVTDRIDLESLIEAQNDLKIA